MKAPTRTRIARAACVVSALLLAILAAPRAMAQPAEAQPDAGAGVDAAVGSAPDAGAGVDAAGSAPDAGAAAGAGAGSSAPITVDIPVDADAPAVRAAPENASPLLGEPFTLFVYSESGPGVAVNLREPVDLGPAFEVRRQVSSIKRRSDGGQLVEWQLEVMAWEIGDLVVPPIAVTFTSGGRAGQVYTKPAPIRIGGHLAEDDDGKSLRGMAPPTELYRRQVAWPWVIGGGLALGLLAGLLVWRWTRRRPAPSVAAPIRRARGAARPGPLALERLAELEASGRLLSQQRAAYGDLAEILRDLASAYAGLKVADLTTAELLAAISGHPATRHAEEPLRDWMRQVDRVKYAGERASEAQVASVLAEARSLVEVIAERPAPAKAASAAAAQDDKIAVAIAPGPASAPPADARAVWGRPAKPAAVLVDEPVDSTVAAREEDGK